MADQLDRNDIYSAEIEQPQSEGLSLKKIGMDLAKFTLGMAVLHKATGFAAKSIFNRVSGTTRLAPGISKALGKPIGELSQSITLGKLASGTLGAFAENPAMGKSLSNASKILLAGQRTGINLGRQMMQSKNVGIKALGYVGKYYTKTLPVAAGFYAISKPLGLDEGDRPSWYNVPGHVAAIGKLTAEFAAFDGALVGLKKGTSLAANKIISKLQYKDNPGLYRVLDKTFGMRRTVNGAEPGSFMNKVMQTSAVLDGIRRAGAARSAHVSRAVGNLWGNKLAKEAQYSPMYDMRRKEFYTDLKERVKLGFKSGYDSRVSKVKGFDSTYATAALDSLTGIMAKHLNQDPKIFSKSVVDNANDVVMQLTNKPLPKGFAGQFKKVLDAKHKIAGRSMGSSVGRGFATVEDVLANNATQRSFSNKLWNAIRAGADDLAKPEIDNLQKSFLGMYAGKNVVKGSHGSIIDYSMYTPRNMLGAITNFITPGLNFTIPFTGGKTLPIGKFLGLERYLTKEGLNIGSIGTHDQQYYKDTITGHMRRVGVQSGTTSGLGGVLIDGELFIHDQVEGLIKANAPKMKLIESSPYASESVLYKLHADAATRGNKDSIKIIQELEEKSQSGGGIFQKFGKFIQNRGLQTPDLLSSLSAKIQSSFGIGPKTMGVKHAAEYILGTKSASNISKADFNSLLSTIPYLGEQSSKNLYGALSNPRMLRAMGKLASQNGYGKNHVGKFEELSTLMGRSDDDMMAFIRKNRAFEDDSEMQYALKAFDKNRYGFDDPVGFKFGKMPLSNKTNLHRQLIEQAMGKVYGLGAQGGSTFNFAADMLKNNDILGMFSKEEVRDLRMVATNIDLHTGGFLNKSGTYFSKEGESQTKAVDIISKYLGNERAYLEKSLYDTPLIHGIGLFSGGRKAAGLDRIRLSESLEAQQKRENPFNRDYAHGTDLLVEQSGGFLRTINYYIDKVMSMGTHFGLRYGMKERGDGYITLGKGLTSFLPKSAPVFTKNILEKVTNKKYYIGGPLKQLSRRVAQGVGVLAAAQALDTFVDVNPLFDGTAFDNGIFVPVAETYAKASMAFHKVQDLTGITEAAKYLDGLMPGSLSTIPGMIIGGMSRGPLGILGGAVINRAMDAVGLYPKFDKSYDEMAGMYSGRELVPVRRNRFWLFGKSPYEGDGPSYFRPHWLPRLRSQYKYTDTLYGSKAEAFIFKPWVGLGFNPLGHIIDKYHHEKTHYWDRPYPVTSAAFTDTIIGGPILSATIGRLPIIGKPIKYMHEEEMSGYYSKQGNTTSVDGELATSHMANADATDQLLYMNKKANLAADQSLYGQRPKSLNPYGVMNVLGEQMYNFTEFAGLPGYKLETLMGGHPGDFNPRFSTSNEMTSVRRAFWDLNMGDYFASSEFFRRFVPKEKKVWEKVNPLRNKMSSWLPSQEGDYFVDFLTGDAFCVSKNTFVNINHIYIKAEFVKVNDIIYTHKGNYLPVKNIVKRPILKNEKCYSLKVAGINNISLEFSQEHPLYIKKISYCSFGSSCICRPIRNINSFCDSINNNKWSGRGRPPNGCKNTWIKEDIKFIPIKDVDVNSYLVYKIPQENKEVTLNYVYLQRDNTRSSEYKVNGSILLDEDLSWVLGLYLSEGSTGKNKSKKPLQLIFSMNKNEVGVQEQINEIIYKKFEIKGTLKIKDESSELVFSSTKLAQIFANWIPGNLYEKNIPDFIFTTNNNNKLAFLFGCYLGDGYISNKRLSYECANQNIVFGLRRLSFELGIPASYNDRIRFDKRTQKETKSFITEIHVFCIKDFNLKYLNYKKDIIDLNFDRLPNIDNFSDSNYIYQKIIGKEEIQLDYVYGFEVDNDDSFCVMDFATHNTKISEGEIRLPGSAYDKLYDVKRTFPGRASSLGKSVNDLVKGMVGFDPPDTEDAEDIMATGTAMHRYIQDSMIRNNIGYKAEQLVYDAKEDISGHIDLLMYDPYRKGGKRPLEIKTINAKGFGKLKGPHSNHISQLNFYLRQMQMEVGTILYINRDDPTQIRTFDVRYIEERFRRDVQDLRKARTIAAQLMTSGKGFENGASYSWLDRYRILGDVAPYSNEYKQAGEIVALQLRANRLPESAKDEVRKIKQHRKSVMRKFDLYPTRFRNRVFNPDVNYELQSENTNIKAAAEYSFGERVLGSIWERAIQMDTPLNTKLWSYRSPLQHYQRTKLYGTDSASWNRPYQDLIKPMFTKALSADNPMDAAASFGWIGAIGLGGMGNMGIPGAVFGGLYGAARSLVGNDAWIPDEVNKKREIERTFDQLKYVKNMELYNQTGDERYQTAASETLWNISHSGYQVGVRQAMRSISSFEKPYFLTWMKETNPIERENILEHVPEEVGNLLKAKWGMSYDLPKPSKYEMMIPNSDWEGLLPNDNLDDIKYKTINQEGLRANDFGMGWYDQQRRTATSQFELNPIENPNDILSSNNVASRIKSALMRTLGTYVRRPLISISITPGGSDSVKLNIRLMRDRFNDIKEALRTR